MAKDPAERRQTMHDVLIDLRWIAEGGGGAVAAARAGAPTGGATWRWKAAAAVLGIAAAAFGALYSLRPEPEDPPMRVMLSPPENTTYGWGLAISPDGLRVAFMARSSDSAPAMLWVRSIDSLESRQIAGTAEAQFPFWSPDGRHVGFFANGKLKRVDLDRGTVQVLADAADGRGGSWNHDGTILFSGSTNTPISRIAASGGTPVAVTQIDSGAKEASHRWPHFLPDGRHFVCLVYMGAKGGHFLAAGSLDSKTLKHLMPADSAPAYSAPGRLLYVRGDSLVSQSFDAGSLAATGGPVSVSRNVAAEGEAGPTAYARFSVSRSGRLVYVMGPPVKSILTWLDRSGKTLETVGEAGNFGEPALSPDGNRVAYSWIDSPVGPGVWVFDMKRKVATRLAHRGGGGGTVAWSPDGSKIVHTARESKKAGLYLRSANGAGDEELLSSSEHDQYSDGWSPDGQTLVMDTIGPSKKFEIWTLSMSDRKLAPLIQSEANNCHGALSANGRWLAYASDETGRPEIYVRSFPVPNEKYMISQAGGNQPMWRADSQELFYLTLQRHLMATPVKPGATFSAGMPTKLFDAPVPDVSPNLPDNPRNTYVPAANGEKFLMIATQEVKFSAPIVLMTNWSSELGR
jgi:Tol biopolymer transport system component